MAPIIPNFAEKIKLQIQEVQQMPIKMKNMFVYTCVSIYHSQIDEN